MTDSVFECREHHFGPNGRCRYCQMKLSYYHENMATLNSWSAMEKNDPREHWQEKVDGLKCKPHTHPES